jgi:hypothetical protein
MCSDIVSAFDGRGSRLLAGAYALQIHSSLSANL